MVQLLNRPSRYQLEVSEKELSLICRALALFSGEAIAPKPPDIEAAKEINLNLLALRKEKAKQSLKAVEDAYENLRH